mgnify:CR=1 FL=1
MTALTNLAIDHDVFELNFIQAVAQFFNWDVQGSVTGYRPGDRIALSEDVFTRLTEVFLDPGSPPPAAQ